MGRGQTGQRRPVTKGPGRPAIGRTGSRRVVPKGRGQTNLGWREGGREGGREKREGGGEKREDDLGLTNSQTHNKCDRVWPEVTSAKVPCSLVKFVLTVGGEIYRAHGSSLYLMTGTRDVTTCADM